MTNRDVTSKKVTDAMDEQTSMGYPRTGHMTRDGNTFEDAEFGKIYDEAFDAVQRLLNKVIEIKKEAERVRKAK